MRLKRISAAIAATAALGVLALLAGPAGAVVGGTADDANRYPNVGVLQLQVAPGAWVDFCSGTLVRPDVVLTAAHCTDFIAADLGEPFGPEDLRVSFAPDGDSLFAEAESVVVHDGWWEWLATVTPHGNSKRLYLAPPAQDIALIFLEADAGITPAPIADADYLAGLDLTKETFTVVGYGVDGFATGGAGSNHPTVIDDGKRAYRDVTAITKHDAYPDRFLKITAGVCFGDSGGPLFHDGTVVAINTWTFSYRCSGPNLEYRVDSTAALEFLDENL